jgi:hypothetical protein
MRDDFDWSRRRPVYSSEGSGRGSGRKTTMTASPRWWYIEGRGNVTRLKAGSKKQAKGRGSGRTTRASRRRAATPPAIDLGGR